VVLWCCGAVLLCYRDALRSRNNLFAEGVMGLAASLQRPLLVLLDRNFDMAAALQHSWTYKPLVSSTAQRGGLLPDRPRCTG
jgi:hypothetical protein